MGTLDPESDTTPAPDTVLNPCVFTHRLKEAAIRRGRILRHARLYGYLVARTGRVYHPGGGRPVCSEQTALDMVRAGWLVRRGDRFEITPEGLRVLESQSPHRPDEGQVAYSRADTATENLDI